MVPVLQPLKNHKPIPIDRAVILVGRGEDCDVLITGSKKISRKHCCLVQSDQCFLIRDLGSTNGVWVNGKRVDQEAEITEGDRVAIADVQFRFFPNGVRRSDSQRQQSVYSDGSNHPADSVKRNVPDKSRRHKDTEDISESPTPKSKGKGRPFRNVDESKPIIDLDDRSTDQEIEDIIIFDDE